LNCQHSCPAILLLIVPTNFFFFFFFFFYSSSSPPSPHRSVQEVEPLSLGDDKGSGRISEI